MAAAAPPANNYVRLVVYCDEEAEPYTLPDVHLPRNLEVLQRLVEDKVGQRAKLLSYWNFAHHRYELLRDVRELLQEEGRLAAGSSPPSARPGSRRASVDRNETSTSRSGASSSNPPSPPTRSARRVYRCQLWLETVLLQLEPLDPRRDKAEYEELCHHVSRWLGNKHVGYEVRDAVRIRCPFLTRMFDETRSARLAGNQDKVQLLYYSNNAWGVRDVLQYGFLLSHGVPKSITAVVQAQGGASDISTTTDTRLSIPVPAQAATAAAAAAAAPSPPVSDQLDTHAHPFIFTSSMLAPQVRHLPPRTPPHKVLLCEVAPGRRFMTDQSLTGEHTDKQSFPLPGRHPTPHGYDSVCYMRAKDDKTAVRSGDESSAKAEELSIVQVQVGHSYQALPRYLLTVAPTGGPPPAHSSFDSAVSATASPVRAPGSTAAAAAAAAEEDEERRRQAAAQSRSGRLQDWWTSRPFHNPQERRGEEAGSSRGTPMRRPASASAPLSRQWGDGVFPVDGAADTSASNYVAGATPRRAASALTTPRRSAQKTPGGMGTPYPGNTPVQTPRAHSQPRPYHAGNTPKVLNASPRALPASPSSPPQHRRLSDSGAGVSMYGYGGSQSQHGGSIGLAPPTPPSPARRGSEQESRDGILYRGLHSAAKAPPSSTVHERDSSLPPWPSSSRMQGNRQRGTSHPLQQQQLGSMNAAAERPSMPFLVPPYHSDLADTSHSGESTVPLPAPLPPASIIRAPGSPLASASPQQQRLAQPPPAAFNHFLCPIHPRQLQSLYCVACQELTCPYCASVGGHRDHVVVEASDRISVVHAEVHKLHEELRHWLSEYQRTEQELRAEQASWATRQQRELRSLQHNFQSLRQSLQLAERTMTQAVQQRSCPPPFAEAAAVVQKYVQALAPIGAALRRFHVAQDGGLAPAPPHPQRPNGVYNGNGGGRGATRSVPEMLHFLRTAPPLLHRVQESFVQQHRDEERRLRDAVAAYHARVDATEGVYDGVDWVGLRRLLEHIGSTRVTRPVRAATTRERSPQSRSPPHPLPGAMLSFSNVDGADSGGSRGGSAVRVRGRSPLRSSPTRHTTLVESRDVSRRLLGRSSPPVRSLVIGDDLASYMSHHTSPSPRSDRLLLRCLADLQRGHIWAIQDASFYFAPGQLKAVCSTPFRLAGAQWELRIAPLPPSHRAARRSSSSAPTSTLITPGVNAGMMAATAATFAPAGDGSGGGNGDVNATGAMVARSPLATHSLPDEDRGGPDTDTSSRVGSPEEEWLGLFMFPLQHRLRMDFRVIAFSEVTWAEWQVTGWTTEMAGKGWGLYPFLQRKELMRTDKLARDNIVKICIAPISDLY